jgi:hypothetical protein
MTCFPIIQALQYIFLVVLFVFLPTVEEVSFDATFLEGERLYQQAWFTVWDRTHVRFGLTSCGYAELVLSAAAYSMEFEYFYKLEIQTEHNHTLIW